ncbi:MAG: rhodanese-like domain-containing protein [Acidobacteriota bacterium]
MPFPRTLAAAALCLVFACPACVTSRRVVESLTANCREVQPGVANEMIRDNPRALLLDVRHGDEFSAELPHLQRCREVPLSELPRRYSEIGAWKKETIVIFSRDGTDAASACEFLARQGFLYVSHVEGGVAEWQRRRFGLFGGSGG